MVPITVDVPRTAIKDVLYSVDVVGTAYTNPRKRSGVAAPFVVGSHPHGFAELGPVVLIPNVFDIVETAHENVTVHTVVEDNCNIL